MGASGAAAALKAGANDLGGTLMNESISRAAGASHGQEFSPAQMEALAAHVGRPARQRNTLYGEVDPARTRAAGAAIPLSEVRNAPVVPASRRARMPA
jgi:FO synthase